MCVCVCECGRGGGRCDEGTTVSSDFPELRSFCLDFAGLLSAGGLPREVTPKALRPAASKHEVSRREKGPCWITLA